ncbi:MAG: phosphotransferase [Anaerolineales bacterium]|nr:phosphotransferase [Anaerolineales bacterium]
MKIHTPGSVRGLLLGNWQSYHDGRGSQRQSYWSGPPRAGDEVKTDHFPVQHSILNQNALAEWVLSRYSLSEPVQCRFLRGSMSDVYRVDTHDAAYILKIYLHNRHEMRAIASEVDFLNDLLDHDIPVAVPVANNDAAYLNAIDAPEGIRYAVLFEAIEGDEPREVNLEHSRSFGRLAGRIHTFSDNTAKKYDRRHLNEKYLVEEPLTRIRPYLEHRKRDWEYLRALGSELVAELRTLVTKESPEYGLCHGDLHTGNARFDKDGRLTLFDFDSFGYGWRAIDIGVYHVSYDWLDLSEKTRRAKDRFWEAFVEGYATERSLSRNELAAAQLCLPLRHLELMGLTLQYWSPQIGTSWINDDYFDEQLDWFKEWTGVTSKAR